MRPKITVITATTGRESLHDAIDSVKAQKNKCHHIVVYDGVAPELFDDEDLTVIGLPFRTGFATYNGHRIYASMGILANTPFVAYLDDDNTFTPDWSEKMIDAMYQDRIMPWAVTCRRTLVRNGKVMGVDNRESIGINEWGYALYDMNTYLLQSNMCKHVADLLAQRHIADRHLAKFLIDNNAVRHITDPLVNYEVNEPKLKALTEVVK
jgi:GT2 family glycosyltransferase